MFSEQFLEAGLEVGTYICMAVPRSGFVRTTKVKSKKNANFQARKIFLVPNALSLRPDFRTGFRKILRVQLVCQDLIGENRRIAKSRVRIYKKIKN